MRGHIKRLTPVAIVEGRRKGGFGFIRDEGEHDRFFSANDLRGPVDFTQLLELHNKNSARNQPTWVEFEPIAGRTKGNGLAAELVRVIV